MSAPEKQGRAFAPRRSFDFDLFEPLKTESLRTGDMVFFHGTDVESQVIQLGTSSPWSHVGTVLMIEPETLKAFKEFLRAVPGSWKEKWAHPLVNLIRTPGRRGKTDLPSPAIAADDRRKHVAETFVALRMLESDEKMRDVLDSESRQVSSESDARTAYMWESTTSWEEPARCLLTDSSKPGVKLTSLKERLASGYSSPVGVRRPDVCAPFDGNQKTTTTTFE